MIAAALRVVVRHEAALHVHKLVVVACQVLLVVREVETQLQLAFCWLDM
jgi:hypothetical protein